MTRRAVPLIKAALSLLVVWLHPAGLMCDLSANKTISQSL